MTKSIEPFEVGDRIMIRYGKKEFLGVVASTRIKKKNAKTDHYTEQKVMVRLDLGGQQEVGHSLESDLYQAIFHSDAPLPKQKVEQPEIPTLG